jgi:hypothetical protein
MKKMMGLLVGIAVCAGVVLAESWAESKYVSQTSILGSHTIAYTNGTSRSTLASVMVTPANATNTWYLYVVNNDVTNLLKSATLSTTATTLLYESGNVPLGGSAVLYATGSIFTNSTLTNVVKMAVHTRQ